VTAIPGVMRSYRLSIDQFIGHFGEHLEKISQVPNDMYRKVLYALILDPLAQAAYPPAGSRSNVVSLIRNLTSWADADRISLFQLKLSLRQERRGRFRLYREVSRRLALQPVRFKTPLSHSPHVSELASLAATKQEQKLLNLATYANLFYTYRSYLAHEFREPGYGSDWDRESTEPYYGKSVFGEREIVFPLAFVSSLAHQALGQLHDHLAQNRIAPHSKFRYGSQWHAY
jgi:hypothetical protein